MNTDQSVHIGMINTYNVIMEKATAEEIILSGIGIFAHPLDYNISVENVDYLIEYFESLEMFEYCADLQKYKNDTYNSDGSVKDNDMECSCELPLITEYKIKMKCSHCNKRLKL